MSLSLADAAEIVGKQFWRMALVGGLCAGVAGWAMLTSPPTYEARALLLYKLGREYLYVPDIDEAASGVRSPDPGDLMQIVGAEMQIFTNRDLRRSFLQDFGVERIFAIDPTAAAGGVDPMDVAIEQLRRIVTVGLVPNTLMAEVRVRHGDPVVAAEMTNQLIEHYLRRRAEIFGQRDSGYLQRRLEAARAGAVDIEGMRRTLMGGADPLVFETDRDIRIARQATIETEISEVETSIVGFLSRRASLERELQSLPQTIVEFRNVERNPIAADAQNRVQTLSAQREAMSASLGVGHPTVSSLDREIEALRLVVANEPAEIEVGGRIAVNPARSRAEVDLAAVNVALSEAEARRKHLAAERDANAAALAQSASVFSELSALEQAAAIQLAQVAKFEASLRDSLAEDAGDGGRPGSVRVLEHATPPAIPVDPPKSVRLIVALLFGGIVGLAAGGLSYFSRPTVLTARMLEQRLGAPTLAEIPHRRPRRGAPTLAV